MNQVLLSLAREGKNNVGDRLLLDDGRQSVQAGQHGIPSRWHLWVVVDESGNSNPSGGQQLRRLAPQRTTSHDQGHWSVRTPAQSPVENPQSRPVTHHQQRGNDQK